MNGVIIRYYYLPEISILQDSSLSDQALTLLQHRSWRLPLLRSIARKASKVNLVIGRRIDLIRMRRAVRVDNGKQSTTWELGTMNPIYAAAIVL